MAFFTWADELNTGIESIDRQHRELVGILNELYDAMQAGHGASHLERSLEQLFRYAGKHFETEEQLMSQHDFPQYEEHRDKHAHMTQHLVQLRSKMMAGHCGAIEVARFVRDWLHKHIGGTDRGYAEHLRACGVS